MLVFFVSRGKMRENTVDHNARHVCDLRNLRGSNSLLLLVKGGKAKAVHSRIKLDMRAYGNSRLGCGAGELFGIIEGGNGLDEVLLSNLADEPRICGTENEEQKTVTAAQVVQISKMQGIVIDGFFSHFASADEEGEHAKKRTSLQSIRFFDTLDRIRLEGINPRVIHLCNSPGAFTRPAKDLADAARIGISLFGFGPAPGIDLGLRPTFKLCAKIARVSRLTPGEELGYGGIYKVEKEINAATVGIGYADGVFRHAAGHEVSIYSPDGTYRGSGKIIGRVCMDMCMLDLGSTPAAEGDTVVFFGDEHVTCLDFANHCNTIVHECLSLVSGRVPRIVINDKE